MIKHKGAGKLLIIPFQEFSVDIVLRQWWTDRRLNYENYDTNATRLELDTRLLADVWQPDLYFKNEKKGSLHTITNTNKLMHIYRNGTVIFSMRYFRV